MHINTPTYAQRARARVRLGPILLQGKAALLGRSSGQSWPGEKGSTYHPRNRRLGCLHKQ